MGSIFGKSKKSRVTEQDKAVLQLKQQRDRLKQYQKRIEGQLERDRDLARELLKNGKKDKALLLLRKKKFQEQQLDKAEGMLSNIEQMTHDLEFAQVEMKVLDGLKAGNSALKKIHDVLSIDEIEKIMDESREGIEKQREIDEMLQGHLTSEDEEDVLEELEEIINNTEGVERAMLGMPDIPTELPEVTESGEASSVRKKEKVRKIAVEAS